MSANRWHTTLVLGLALSLAAATMAHATRLPPKIEAVFFKKILSYNKTLAAAEAPAEVLIVATDDQQPQAQALAAAFTQVGLSATITEPAAVASGLRTNTALYLLPGASNATVCALAVKEQVFTMSGDASMAEQGSVSVSLAVKADGRPEIVVSLARLKNEGHVLEPALLNLARVIR